MFERGFVIPSGEEKLYPGVCELFLPEAIINHMGHDIRKYVCCKTKVFLIRQPRVRTEVSFP